MKDLLEKLKNVQKGRGTYLTAGALALLSVGVFAGYVDLTDAQWKGITGALAAAAAIFLRRAIGAPESADGGERGEEP